MTTTHWLDGLPTKPTAFSQSAKKEIEMVEQYYTKVNRQTGRVLETTRRQMAECTAKRLSTSEWTWMTDYQISQL